MLRNVYEANDISSLLVGFTVVGVKGSTSTDEDGNEKNVVVITYANEHHVAVNMFIGSDGVLIGEPYAVKDDLSMIKASEIKSLTSNPDKRHSLSLEEKLIEKRQTDIAIQKTLNQIGMPNHLKGYQLMISTIKKCLADRTELDCITKRLYPELAEESGTTPSRVERAIRNAIEVSWCRGNVEVLRKMFGYTVDNRKGKPTNSEFIAYICDFIELYGGEIASGVYLF